MDDWWKIRPATLFPFSKRPDPVFEEGRRALIGLEKHLTFSQRRVIDFIFMLYGLSVGVIFLFWRDVIQIFALLNLIVFPILGNIVTLCYILWRLQMVSKLEIYTDFETLPGSNIPTYFKVIGALEEETYWWIVRPIYLSQVTAILGVILGLIVQSSLHSPNYDRLVEIMLITALSIVLLLGVLYISHASITVRGLLYLSRASEVRSEDIPSPQELWERPFSRAHVSSPFLAVGYWIGGFMTAWLSYCVSLLLLVSLPFVMTALVIRTWNSPLLIAVSIFGILAFGVLVSTTMALSEDQESLLEMYCRFNKMLPWHLLVGLQIELLVVGFIPLVVWSTGPSVNPIWGYLVLPGLLLSMSQGVFFRYLKASERYAVAKKTERKLRFLPFECHPD